MPRKPQVEPVDVPPGPLSLVIRAGSPGQEKIVCGQHIYSYEIDQSDPALVVVYGHLRPVEAPVEAVVPQPVVEVEE